MHSAIYRGSLDHRRFLPRAHAFRYPLFLMYLDLAELGTVFRGRWLWSASRVALARFDRRDHLGDPSTPLDVAVRDIVQQRTGVRPGGPIRLLTHLRYFGHCFNPVSFYYCFDAGDTQVETIVAEVNNTPWGERHCYVLADACAAAPAAAQAGAHRRYRTKKVFHVSPFMPMDLQYDWGFSAPGERIGVHMALSEEAAVDGPAPRKLFDATLGLRRIPIGCASLAAVLLRHPFMTLQVIAAIHWQALRLWLKHIPFQAHPGNTQSGHLPAEKKA